MNLILLKVSNGDNNEDEKMHQGVDFFHFQGENQ